MLENIVYCPVLHTRQAEIKALIQLPVASKQRMFPLLVARPWPNAKDMKSTWEKINEAFGGRKFALDLDQSRFALDKGKSAFDQFDQLFDSSNGFAKYYEAIEAMPFAVPVLRIDGNATLNFANQEQHIERLDRGVVCRIQYMSSANLTSVISDIVRRFPDLVVFIDTGWTRDLLTREAWASQMIERITEERPEAEIVVTGSSFPDNFSDVAARAVCDLRERTLYSNLVRRHNAATLVYGDWGSTRPTPEPSPMKIIPRIDLPTRGNWIFFRQDKNKARKETYSDIAKRIRDGADWNGVPSIWGAYIIECTADDAPGGIRSPSTATAVRVNIHLHRQAFFNDPDVVDDVDEPYTDD